MGFTEDFVNAITTLELTGERAIRVDLLAALIPDHCKPKSGQMAGEVLAEKVKMFSQLHDMGEATFPFELVSHRERKSAGVEFDGVIYKEMPLMDGGKPKTNKNGEPAMQRYYWPAIVRRNTLKDEGFKVITDLALELSNSGQLPESRFTVEADGLTLTIRYILPTSTESQAPTVDKLRSVA